MLRTHTCGELSTAHINKEVTLCGWVQRVGDKGKIIWIDLRDRYGITQLLVEEGVSTPEVLEVAKQLGREYVIQVKGKVIQRIAPNKELSTGSIEIQVAQLVILNDAKLPPF